MIFALRINGKTAVLDIEADTPLLWVLRDELKLTETKYGCGIGLCGACTVHMDGAPVRSCQIDVAQAEGCEITTLEGVEGPVADAVAAAWRELDAAQCGYCRTGQVMTAIALLAGNGRPEDAEIVRALDGCVCRCACYLRIRAAVRRAAEIIEEAR